ncbi:hypothetical protein SCOR_02455 [Sulfidibacter corallicola]
MSCWARVWSRVSWRHCPRRSRYTRESPAWLRKREVPLMIPIVSVVPIPRQARVSREARRIASWARSVTYLRRVDSGPWFGSDEALGQVSGQIHPSSRKAWPRSLATCWMAWALATSPAFSPPMPSATAKARRMGSCQKASWLDFRRLPMWESPAMSTFSGAEAKGSPPIRRIADRSASGTPANHFLNRVINPFQSKMMKKGHGGDGSGPLTPGMRVVTQPGSKNQVSHPLP